MGIGEILKNLRKENGLTQEQLAERLKIGQATIACYENGKREPNISNLIAYADYFECSLDFIAGRCDDFGNITVKAEKTEKGLATLSADELNILKKYRALKATDRGRAEGYLDGLLK